MTRTLKNIFIILLLIYVCIVSIYAQTTFEKKYGNGMLVITYDTNYVLNLYNKPDESTLVFNIIISLDTASESKNLTANITSEQKSWFHPETFWDEEKIMHFVVVETKGNWHKIIVDKNSQMSMWVLKNTHFKYFKWKDYLQNTTGIERIKPANNQIYKSIFPLKTTLEFDGQNCFKILRVKGNWVIYKYNTNMCPVVYHYKITPKGWFKWRDENGLLIHYFLR